MRSLFSRAVLAGAVVVAGALPPAQAADLDYTGQVPLLSCGEPWVTTLERPPSIGRWYFTESPAPTVNFLVPCRRAAAPTPGTPRWVAYCSQRWPSFNPATGWIETPDGPRRCF